MFIFTFQDREDLSRVLNNRPWTIMGGLLMLAICTSGQVPNELKFSYSAFWIQAHGLPLDYLTTQNGSKISALIELFVLTDWEICQGKVSWRKFLRLRVVLDVRKPILAGFWLKRCGLPDIWIDFKYENLGVSCYKCGRIGTCKFPAGHGKFGPWLRAANSWDCQPTVGGHPNCRSRLRVVYARSDPNACTTLLAVPKAEVTTDESSNVEDTHCEEICERVEFEQTPLEAESIPRRNQRQSLILNSIDSMILLINCALSFSADVSEGNWIFPILMAAYMSHLLCKFTQVRRNFLDTKNGLIPTSGGNCKAIGEILISVVFLVMLVSF